MRCLIHNSTQPSLNGIAHCSGYFWKRDGATGNLETIVAILVLFCIIVVVCFIVLLSHSLLSALEKFDN